MLVPELTKVFFESEFNNSEISADILVPITCMLVIKSKFELLLIELEYISLFSDDIIDETLNKFEDAVTAAKNN